MEPVEDAGDIPQSVRFRPAAELTPEAVAAIAEQVRVRVLRWFARSGLIEADDVREMLAWVNSGFSLDAAVRVVTLDCADFGRLLGDVEPGHSMSALSYVAAHSSHEGDVSSWPTADVRVDRVDLRLVVPQSPETAVDESGGVSPD